MNADLQSMWHASDPLEQFQRHLHILTSVISIQHQMGAPSFNNVGALLSLWRGCCKLGPGLHQPSAGVALGKVVEHGYELAAALSERIPSSGSQKTPASAAA
jgi:hypothetical protein